MTSSLRIAEVADRVGISTATVRYYERIGFATIAGVAIVGIGGFGLALLAVPAYVRRPPR